MEEKKLTDEEIVRALECCAVEPCEDCGNCPRFTKEKLCHKANAKQSLDLIRRLQSENKRLSEKAVALEVETNNQKAKIERIAKVEMDLIGKIADKSAEIERLTEEEKRKLLHGMYEQGKFDGVVKFAERVKMAFYYEFDELIPSIMADKIDEICKEITEGKTNASKTKF